MTRNALNPDEWRSNDDESDERMDRYQRLIAAKDRVREFTRLASDARNAAMRYDRLAAEAQFEVDEIQPRTTLHQRRLL